MFQLSSSGSTPGASGIRAVCLLVLLFFLNTVAGAQTPGVKTFFGLSQQGTTTAAASPASTAPAKATSASPIPLPDVASRSEELKRTLRDVSDQLPTSDQLAATKATLDERDDQLQSREKGADELLSTTPSTLELREEENYWRAQQKQTAEMRAQLLTWANAAQSGVQQLQAQQPAWNATLEQNKSTPELGPTLDVIEKSVNDLSKLTTQAQDELRIIVNQQVRAANQDQLAIDVIGRLEKIRQYLDSQLFERDSLPLWQLGQRRRIGENKEAFQTATNRMLGIQAFASQTSGGLVALTILLVLSLFGAYRLHLKMRGLQPQNQCQAEVLHMANHWIALGVLPALLFAYLLAPLAPLPLIGLVILASFVPILILLPPLINPKLRVLLYWIAGVYTANATVAWIAFSPAHKREMQFLANFAVFVLFAYLVRPRRLPRLSEAGRLRSLRIFGIRVAVALLGVSLVANFFGYVKLAHFLGILCLYSTFIAISMFTGVRVFTRLLLESVEAEGAQELAIIRLYKDGVVRWLPRVFQWTGTAIWLFATINLLGLSDWVTSVFEGILGFHIAGGSANITLGGVLGFFLILLVGYGISSAVRFLLREELLSRFHLSRGLPELISSMLHYLLLLLVFFFAINAGGVELNKFTVLTGALGVGVGFGLQNIVNNFISGLILQFERPIHVGDVLEIDGTTGKVTRIGIRSSTIKTFQGAEVIIPNGNFISGKVINWTLSESQRRVELPVGVAYGSNAKLVAKLLEQAATVNESVLISPPPAVYFKEFADSSLNFELQFWVMQESNTTKVKSEVALAVMELLDRAGIEIPYPQRDLRLRAIDPGVATALAPGDRTQTASGNHHGDTEEPVAALEDANSRAAEQLGKL